MKNLFSRVTGEKNTSQANPVIAPAYTKEFAYLPSYHWIQSFEYTPATAEVPLGKAKYLIPNTSDTQVYEGYKAILEGDGWTITQETQVINFSAEKDTHLANISFSISDKDVLVIVQSK